jgi:PPK2 family polyphosphate:nucleotide phosphotransferase
MSKSHRLDHRPFLVPPGQKIRLKDYDPAYTAGFGNKAEGQAALLHDVSELARFQDIFWASKKYALIIVLQALDAAGKDGIIEHVMSGLNPQGVTVHSFKAPTDDERMHHFLWRPLRVLPPAGSIAIFNRSYYEEVLVVRVHPEFLDSQWLPDDLREQKLNRLWQRRYDEINSLEQFLVDGNTLVLKFFLNVSKEEQRQRFLARIKEPAKNWKFSLNDVRERGFWDEYQRAYEDMLSATSTKAAPWYVIPADNKWFARASVADIVTAQLEKLNLQYPSVSEKQHAALQDARRQLEQEK